MLYRALRIGSAVNGSVLLDEGISAMEYSFPIDKMLYYGWWIILIEVEQRVYGILV